MKRVLLFLVLAFTACDGYHPAENYCEAEQRRIPDIELKGRLLASIRSAPSLRQSWGLELPVEMEQYLLARGLAADDLENPHLSATARKMTALALIDFVEKNPLCCQLAVKEVRDKSNHPGENDESDTRGWFANFYVQSTPYVIVPDGGDSELNQELGTRPRSYKKYRAFNCGIATPALK